MGARLIDPSWDDVLPSELQAVNSSPQKSTADVDLRESTRAEPELVEHRRSLSFAKGTRQPQHNAKGEIELLLTKTRSCTVNANKTLTFRPHCLTD